ncbi:MAG: ATP-binding protein [Acidobacteria bacterium]|jgi:predicted ATPase with chaperone activity|nr:MAG: AAA family ATPase [Anaerolineae bacterium]RMG04965.1 MAG: ATP-binding protein [Acidobacteriota bacterium]
MSENQATLRDILAEPNQIEDLKIPQSIILDIIFRLLFNEGNVALARFVEVLKISNRIIDEILAWMQKEHLVEVAKAIGELGRLGYIYTLTEAGEERARGAFERSQYIGPAPVSIPAYNQGIELQTQQRKRVQAAQVKEAIRGLILPDDFHRRIGPAINSGSSLFLYGPPGNGKTTVAQAISRLISGTDPIWIPYAITAGGHIIQIHDRLVHHPVKTDSKRTAEFGRVDGRWGLFYRPTVMVGGELKMDALDLRYDPIAKIYEAPLQLKANGGMFLIDDFGRQQVRPGDLLNRWIVPLENQVDFLRLLSGQTIVVPFKLLLVFSTNLAPYELMDDAFLRRIQIKVELSSPDEKMFAQIFLLECKNHNIPFNKDAFVYLVNKWYKQSGRSMQAVHPRDLLRTIKAICDYEGIPPAMTPELLDQACKSYFVNQ